MPFPKKTALECLLVTERHRRRSDETLKVGFAVPAFTERPIDAGFEPLAATDARGRLVPTRVSRERGVARCGFFECSTENEGALLPKFFDALWEMSRTNGWQNRCNSLSEASARMQLPPRSIVVPYGLVEEVSAMTREEADRLMGLQGYISKGDQQILVADLAKGDALLAASPSVLGFYTRIDDSVGVLMTRVDQAVFLIRGAS